MLFPNKQYAVENCVELVQCFIRSEGVRNHILRHFYRLEVSDAFVHIGAGAD
jgi:hypothetical protein